MTNLMVVTEWNDIRRKLRTRRWALGWSQQKLADKLEVQQSMISDWETGFSVPRSTNLIIWARALGVDLWLQVGDSRD